MVVISGLDSDLQALSLAQDRGVSPVASFLYTRVIAPEEKPGFEGPVSGMAYTAHPSPLMSPPNRREGRLAEAESAGQGCGWWAQWVREVRPFAPSALWLGSSAHRFFTCGPVVVGAFWAHHMLRIHMLQILKERQDRQETSRDPARGPGEF